AYIDKMEQMEHAVKNVELSKHEIIKVVKEVVSEAGVKISGGKDFIKHQDAHLKVLHIEHCEKLRKKEELIKKRRDNYAAKNVELSKSEIIKVVGEVVSEAEVKISGGKDFIKHPDAHLKVLHIEHSEKLRKNQEMIK
ncbi:hypothetical protein Tco_0230041, partial [Tanacetum coccineum]